MKIIRADNFARESRPESLVAENIRNEEEAKLMLEALQATCHPDDSIWYRLVEDNHILWRGMAEFVDPDFKDEAWRCNE